MGCHYKCLVYTRMIFYLSVISIHVTNIFVILSSFTEESMRIKGVRDFYETQFYFITCWNFTFQIAYAAFALFCDWASLGDIEKKPALPEFMSKIRDLMFAVLVWPGTLMVCTYFWAFYVFDRNLVYPTYFDEVISSMSNHIMHTLILPIAVAELVLYPKKKPERHITRILAILAVQVIYILTLFYIHESKGIWIYPIFEKLNRCPVGLASLLGFTGFYLSFLYYGQYCISNVVLRCREIIGQRYCKACRN